VTEFRTLRVEKRDDGVRVLTLDDPDKRNAIGPVMREELLIAADILRADAQARALVVTGAGSAFCAGADLNAIFSDGQSPEETRDSELSYYRSFLWVRDLPYPTVAAVDGHAIGAGANLALVCDIVVAGPGAKFGITFSRIGLHPGGGCTHFLTQRLGSGRAMRLILRGDTVLGEEAVALGLADVYADDAFAEAVDTAQRVARLHPGLAADIKKSVRLSDASGFDAVLGYESWAQAASSYHAGVRESIRATGRSTATLPNRDLTSPRSKK
jgi:enoyl-CoA hydratase